MCHRRRKDTFLRTRGPGKGALPLLPQALNARTDNCVPPEQICVPRRTPRRLGVAAQLPRECVHGLAFKAHRPCLGVGFARHLFARRPVLPERVAPAAREGRGRFLHAPCAPNQQWLCIDSRAAARPAARAAAGPQAGVAASEHGVLLQVDHRRQGAVGRTPRDVLSLQLWLGGHRRRVGRSAGHLGKQGHARSQARRRASGMQGVSHVITLGRIFVLGRPNAPQKRDRKSKLGSPCWGQKIQRDVPMERGVPTGT